MFFLLKQTKIVIFLFLITPTFVLASNICSNEGYTVLTLNGIFTNEEEARDNKRELERKLDTTFNNQPLKIDFLHNQSHLAGAGDVLKALEQSLFDNETVEDYDLTEMLDDASQKVTTQKVLIVAHSQGNFYANSFYDVVAGKDGGIPTESIGVYAVATPSGRTSGGGLWLTSTTDKMIAGFVGRTVGRKIMEPNITIYLPEGDDSNGHGFSDVYLKYKGGRIVSDIEKSLNILKSNEEENGACINPPKINLGHRVVGTFFAIADPVANVSSKVVEVGINIAVAKVVQTGAIAKRIGTWTFSAGRLLASSIYSTIDPLIDENSVPSVLGDYVENNSESVEKELVKKRIALEKKVVLTNEEETKELEVLEKNASVEDMNNKDKEEKNNAPRIIHLYPVTPGFGGGGQEKKVEEKQDSDDNSDPTLDNYSTVISILQCNESLSTDGCLLATTTVGISWEPISQASLYEFYLNGVLATTTETNIVLNLDDFKDYKFEIHPVLKVGVSGASATTTASFSLATIPIAINEIAFLGTNSSEDDEWIELKNNTSRSIDLSEWAIEINNGEKLIPMSGAISPNGYSLLAHGSEAISVDNGAIILKWDESYKKILSDTGETIILYHNDTNLDSTPILVGDDFHLASTTNSESVERRSSRMSGNDILNWGLNLGFIKNGQDSGDGEIYGTPGEHNGLSYLINRGETQITEDVTLQPENGPYAIYDEIQINASSTLSILPGTTVYFLKDELGNEGSVSVFGKMVVGGEGDMVVIDSFYGNQTGSLSFIESTTTTTFENVSIKNTEGIRVYNSNLEIIDSVFENNESGINIYGGSNVSIDNVSMTNTEYEAVGVYSSSVDISSSTIANVNLADAISIYDGSNVEISSTTITAVNGDGVGVYDSDVAISSSTISSVGGNGISSYSATTTVESTTITDTGESGIYINVGIASVENTTISGFESGQSVVVYDPDEQVIISDNIIYGASDSIFANPIESITLTNNTFCDENNVCVVE